MTIDNVLGPEAVGSGKPTMVAAPGGASLRWRGEGRSAGRVLERPFEVEHNGQTVPGLLWTPEGALSSPLVLLGHGGGGSKREGYIERTARNLAGRRGLAAAAVDGPVHGDRRADPRAPSRLVVMEFAQIWANDGEAMTDSMVADWHAVLDVLATLPEIRGDLCGWWGLSMGTIVGLPFVAAEPRVKAAVFGLMGLTGPTRVRIERDAPKVVCPILFLAQSDDVVFPRDQALALFDALGSTDKRFQLHVGGHGDLPLEAFEASARFLARHLSDPGAADGGAPKPP